jgi:hypothetical protein
VSLLWCGLRLILGDFGSGSFPAKFTLENATSHFGVPSVRQVLNPLVSLDPSLETPMYFLFVAFSFALFISGMEDRYLSFIVCGVTSLLQLSSTLHFPLAVAWAFVFAFCGAFVFTREAGRWLLNGILLSACIGTFFELLFGDSKPMTSDFPVPYVFILLYNTLVRANKFLLAAVEHALAPGVGRQAALLSTALAGCVSGWNRFVVGYMMCAVFVLMSCKATVSWAIGVSQGELVDEDVRTCLDHYRHQITNLEWIPPLEDVLRLQSVRVGNLLRGVFVFFVLFATPRFSRDGLSIVVGCLACAAAFSAFHQVYEPTAKSTSWSPFLCVAILCVAVIVSRWRAQNRDRF